MKFEGSGSKGTRVIERKRSVTDGQTARRTDGQGKNNMSPPEGGDIMIEAQLSFVAVNNQQFLQSQVRLFLFKMTLNTRSFQYFKSTTTFHMYVLVPHLCLLSYGLYRLNLPFARLGTDL